MELDYWYRYSSKRDERVYLLSKWEGGGKNDIIIVCSLNQDRIEWAKVYCTSQSSLVQIKLADDLDDQSILDTENIGKIISSNIAQYYDRVEMKNYEYLLADMEPSTITILVSLIFGCILSCGLSYFFHREDIC